MKVAFCAIDFLYFGCDMTDLYNAAKSGNLGRVILLVEEGVDKNQIGGEHSNTALSAAAEER